MDTPYVERDGAGCDQLYARGPAGRAEQRRRAHERDVSRYVGLEQVLNALTPLHRRNPASAQRAIERDGYAVYDGPRNRCAACGTPIPPGHRWCSRMCFTSEDRHDDAEEAP